MKAQLWPLEYLQILTNSVYNLLFVCFFLSLYDGTYVSIQI